MPDEDELAETYTRRKGFAYGRAGKPMQQPDLLKSVLAGVDLAYEAIKVHYAGYWAAEEGRRISL